MSFLAKVINTAETVEMDEIQVKIPELTLLVEKMKSEVIQYIENVYVKFLNRPKLHNSLLKNAKRLQDDINRLKQNANEICKKDGTKTNVEFENHKITLEEMYSVSEVIVLMIKSIDCLDRFKCMIELKSYLECIKLIINLQLSYTEIPQKECVNAMTALNNYVCVEKFKLLTLLRNHFNDNITLLTENDVYTIKFKKENHEMLEVLKALYYFHPENDCLMALTNYLLYEVFTNIINFKTDVEIGDNETFGIITVHVKNRMKKDSYTNVFKNLKTVLEFVKCKFNYKFNDVVLDYIGRNIRDDLSELLIKNCLKATIPSNAEYLLEYKVVIEDTEKLETFLRECGIFAADTKSISEYVNNVEVLFITKKCEEYFQLSETIMKKGLQDKVEVGVASDQNNSFNNINILTFNRCCISKSTLELMELAEGILQQIINSSDVASGRFLSTVQNIFHKYVIAVPMFHQKLFETIPQQIALFHNNCIYMANELSKWNEMYSSIVRNLFRKQIGELEEIGTNTFSNCVDNQIKHINEIMKDAVINIQNLEKLEKSVKQCLRQQELLKNVWHDILSYNIYNKTIGLILDSLCVILIDAIVKLEDISSDMAEQFVDILKIVTTEGPKLLTDSREMNLFVPSWNKFNDVHFVLGASLLDVSNRWGDGMGPLTLSFTPYELKRMIRGLFQNTERRSILLTKISN